MLLQMWKLNNQKSKAFVHQLVFWQNHPKLIEFVLRKSKMCVIHVIPFCISNFIMASCISDAAFQNHLNNIIIIIIVNILVIFIIFNIFIIRLIIFLNKNNFFIFINSIWYVKKRVWTIFLRLTITKTLYFRIII